MHFLELSHDHVHVIYVDLALKKFTGGGRTKFVWEDEFISRGRDCFIYFFLSHDSNFYPFELEGGRSAQTTVAMFTPVPWGLIPSSFYSLNSEAPNTHRTVLSLWSCVPAVFHARTTSHPLTKTRQKNAENKKVPFRF